jgi:NADPH:quinone reductase-like Zn-dependent oxidoreductase
MRAIQIREFGGPEVLAHVEVGDPTPGGGELDVTIGGVYPISQAARAHQDLIPPSSTGTLLLDPSK